MIGILYALLAAFGFATSAIFARAGLQRMRATTGTLVSMVAGVAVTIVIAAAIYPSEMVGIGVAGFLWLLLFAFLNFPMGRLLNFTGVQMVGASRASTIIAASPLFTLVLAVAFTGETVNALIVIGTIAIIAGGGLIVSQR